MSSLGSANTSAQVAAALKSAASDCPRNGLEVIVHPRFRRQLEEEPAVFCPLDWLPDEVISNVLVHLVSARLHPRTHRHRTTPNRPTFWTTWKTWGSEGSQKLTAGSPPNP